MDFPVENAGDSEQDGGEHSPRIQFLSVGERASGGAIGIGVGDKIIMMEFTWYSVISP